MLTTLPAALVLSALVPSAEARFVFDHNHPDLEWMTIETEHFQVHYPRSKKKENNEHYLNAEWTAKKSAEIAEEMWPRMCAEFNYYLEETVHIVILDQGDDLEGFTIPSWDWIEISANPGGDFYRQRGRMDWLPDVLVHEFAHVVSLKANGSFAEGAGGLLVRGLYQEGVSNTASGGELVIGDNEPFYWTEGGAEYWSDQAGYNWWTPSRDMHIRTTVLEDRLLSYEEWQTRAQSFRWGDGERGYQQGYSFALYLRDRFGDETYTKFALQHAKGWKPDWNAAVQEITGVSARQLYDDWVAYLREKYGAQYAAVKASGEVAGREIGLAKNDWEFADPAERDAFYDPRWKRKDGITGPELARIEREKAKEATGTWQIVPRYSDDGKWLGVNNRADIEINPLPEEALPAFSGVDLADAGIQDAVDRQTATVASGGHGFMHTWDFVPGKDAVLITGYEHLEDEAKLATRVTGFRHEGDGYLWKNIWYVPIESRDVNDKNLAYHGVKECDVLGVEMPCLPPGAHEVPNTLRGIDPVAAPDGEHLAYLQYGDGTLNVVTIKMDGTEKRALTDFHDGTWIQRMDWSPDGKQLVVAIFRNFQQDLYVFDVDKGGEPVALNFDRWEDQDPHWGKDGRIYFSSDPTGIFNIYALDPATKTIHQVTNVIGGAEAPSITPSGNLLYSAYTAHGWKVYGLPRADFLERDVTAEFNVQPDAAAVSQSWNFREDLSHWQVAPYKATFMHPTAVPILDVQNNARDDVTVQGGVQIYAQDFSEQHAMIAEAMLGSNWYAWGQYMFQAWYPTIFARAFHGEFKYTLGYVIDEDDDPATEDDRTAFEIKNQQYYNFALLGVDYPWNDKWRTFAYALGRDIGFRQVSSVDWEPYKLDGELYISQAFSNLGQYSTSANPRGGRFVDLSFAHAWSDVVYAASRGRIVDDGELMDQYEFNRVEVRWTEQIPVPRWGPVLTAANDHRHTLQVDLDLGVIDRNVDYNDEFRGGGVHPSYTGSNSLRPNTLFAGYPAYSLTGETMAMLNVAYRFPLRRELNKHVGPFYFYDLTMQVMGTAGNLWSYAPPEDPADYYRNEYGERVAKDASSIRREIPFVDVAHKNGNWMLYDAGLEWRLSASAFNRSFWNSFVRVSYGFNEIKGYNDVNGDDLTDTTSSVAGDELSNETERAGFRFYLGLGTGW